MMAFLVAAHGLHAALSPAQGRDIVRRWSPEYRFFDPTETREQATEQVAEFLRVSGELRHMEKLKDGSGTVVLQHTPDLGLALFVMTKAKGDWRVLGQLPAPLCEEGRWRARTAAMKWLRKR